ncbi:DLL1 [Acrasis kona]|uniref:DLL1 n=1 Tax=Acrasis kona TaxID=1008807 RepID=A0AAW2YHS2_9EUKA
MGNSFAATTLLNRTVVKSTKTGSGLNNQNYADVSFDPSTTGNGQWLEVWQYGTINYIMTSLEVNGVSSSINLVYSSNRTAYAVTKQTCNFYNNNTNYRLQVRAIAPTIGTTWVMRGELFTLPDLNSVCSTSLTVYNFNYNNYYSQQFTVAVSTSNAIYTAVNTTVQPATPGSNGALSVLATINRMVMLCQAGTCNFIAPIIVTNSPLLDLLNDLKANPVPIIVVCAVLAGVAVLGGAITALTVLIRSRRKKVKPDSDYEKTHIEKV